jgi:hypothetical protein
MQNFGSTNRFPTLSCAKLDSLGAPLFQNSFDAGSIFNYPSVLKSGRFGLVCRKDTVFFLFINTDFPP